MTDNRKSGIALIAGSLGGMLTMAIHPTSAGTLTPDQFARLAVVSAVAHSLAMVSFVFIFLGAMGLTRRLTFGASEEHPGRLPLAGLVTYGLAAVAVLIATAVSGFIVPDIMNHMIRDAAANASQWHIVIDAVFQFNQAFARIYSVAASTAMVLWSASALRNGGLGRTIAIYGCVLPPALIVLIAAGHLQLNVHGMAIVVLAHAIWFITVGAQLYREPDQPATVA